MASLDGQTVDVPLTLYIGDSATVELGTLTMALTTRSDGLVELNPADGRPVEHVVADMLDAAAGKFREPDEPDEHAKGAADNAAPRR